MTLEFIDAKANEGQIHADFTIEYDGPVQVEAYVDDVLDASPSAEEAIDTLLIDMVQDLDIAEVTRSGEWGYTASDD